MTEDQIERKVEYAVSRLDHRFLNSGMTQTEYDAEIIAIDKWASQQIRSISTPPFTSKDRRLDY